MWFGLGQGGTPAFPVHRQGHGPRGRKPSPGILRGVCSRIRDTYVPWKPGAFGHTHPDIQTADCESHSPWHSPERFEASGSYGTLIIVTTDDGNVPAAQPWPAAVRGTIVEFSIL